MTPAERPQTSLRGPGEGFPRSRLKGYGGCLMILVVTGILWALVIVAAVIAYGWLT